MQTNSVAIADRVAETVIGFVPQRLAVAETDEQRREIFGLRYRTVIELGWARPEEFPGEVEHNEDDEQAIHIGAWEDEELVGGARVVPPTEGRPLPIERDFEIRTREDDVEVGRTVIVPRLRGATGHALITALFAQCWLAMRDRGYTELVSAIPPRLVEVYRSIGFTIIELAPGRTHWGEERVPVRFDVIDSLPSLTKVWGEATREGAA